MRELKLWYKDRLPARINALEEARQEINRKNVEAVDSVRRLAHSLRGSGATYGFPEISEAARLLEEAPQADMMQPMEALLTTLRAASRNGSHERSTILVVEDDEDLAHYMKAQLAAPGREIYVATTGVQAQAILEEKEISLIILDLILPDTDGRNLLLRLRERLATAAIPVIVVTVKGATQTRAECLALGADEYLVKPVDTAELQRAVRARLTTGSDMTRELRRDPLTGLPNRAAFHEAFERARYIATVSGESLSVGIIDLDKFKSVNDLFGHAMGDQVLRRAAASISQSLRASDFVGRWGGEEFVVMLPKTDAAGAVIAMNKALKALRREEMQMGDGRSVTVTFSAGVARVQEGMSAEDAVAEADRFLYQAKEAGQDRVVSETDKLQPSKARILIAEDDELIRLVVRRLLERAGYEVVMAEDGMAALEAAQQAPFSMVISDVRMPQMDGFELVDRLRRIPLLAQTPIVMLTSMGSEEDVVRGFELGADDYIVKPFSSAELLARVRRLLKKA